MLLLRLAVGTSADVKVVLVVIAHLLIVKLQGLLLPLGFFFPASSRRRLFIGFVGCGATRLVNSLRAKVVISNFPSLVLEDLPELLHLDPTLRGLQLVLRHRVQWCWLLLQALTANQSRLLLLGRLRCFEFGFLSFQGYDL